MTGLDHISGIQFTSKLDINNEQSKYVECLLSLLFFGVIYLSKYETLETFNI